MLNYRGVVLSSARLFSFIGGIIGPWRVVSMTTIVGDPLADVTRLAVVTGAVPAVAEGGGWVLRGVTSHERYLTRSEKDQLLPREPSLDRPQVTCAALIPVRKTATWWVLA